MRVYDFSVKAHNGREVALSDYRGKVLLIVNTATGCGFTHQYEELQRLYDKFNAEGLEILDFPCNQFGNQAPGSDKEIHSFCTDRYGITFNQFSKVDVNGENAIPLFKWLTGAEKNENNNIKWNFTKFLINRSGELVCRFEPADMQNLEDKIKSCL